MALLRTGRSAKARGVFALLSLACLLGTAVAAPGKAPADKASAAAASAPATAASQGPRSGDPLIDAANDRFWKGQHRAAAAAYRRALALHPQSADLWFNLGCAEAEAGRLGSAIHALEQALLLRPDDADAIHNLSGVRARAVAGALGMGGDLRVALPGDDDLGTGLLTAVSPGRLAWIFGVSWALVFGLVLVWRRSTVSSRRTAASFGAVISALVALGAAALLVGRTRLDSGPQPGVVLPDVARARIGPGAQYKPSVAVVGGVKVQVQGHDSGYVQVRLPDGSDGWLPEAEVAPLFAPEAEVPPGAIAVADPPPAP